MVVVDLFGCVILEKIENNKVIFSKKVFETRIHIGNYQYEPK